MLIVDFYHVTQTITKAAKMRMETSAKRGSLNFFEGANPYNGAGLMRR